MPLLDLPNELLEAIGKRLHFQADIAALVRTNRLLHSLLVLHLYRINREQHGYQGSAERWGTKRGLLDIVKKVHELGVQEDSDKAFFDATTSAKINILEFLLSTGHPHQPPLENLFSAALAAKIMPMMRFLLAKGVPVDTLDHLGRTPLHAAATYGHPASAKLLLGHGAEVDVRDKNGQTPLARAIQHPGTMRVLLDNGADVNAGGLQGGLNIICICVMYNLRMSLDVCLEYGADPFTKFDQGRTVLHLAVELGVYAIVRSIVQARSPDEEAWADDVVGWTPLTLAIIAGHTGISSLLIEALTDSMINHQDRNGRTALFYAARFGRLETVEELLKYNADATLKDRWGATAIFAAVRNEHEATVQRLLQVPGNWLDDRDGFGHGILWWAKRCSNTNITDLLIEHGRSSGSELDLIELSADASIIKHNLEGCWCDICTRPIGGIRNGYQCTVCYDRHFIICRDCFADEAMTCEPRHRELEWIPFMECNCPVFRTP